MQLRLSVRCIVRVGGGRKVESNVCITVVVVYLFIICLFVFVLLVCYCLLK